VRGSSDLGMHVMHGSPKVKSHAGWQKSSSTVFNVAVRIDRTGRLEVAAGMHDAAEICAAYRIQHA